MQDLKENKETRCKNEKSYEGAGIEELLEESSLDLTPQLVLF